MIKQARSNEDNNETDYLERWFVGNQDNIDDYYKLYSRKVIISPKVLSMGWLKEESLDEVRNMLKFQNLYCFLKLSRNTYPDLVKVFLTNMWYDDEALSFEVKGIVIANMKMPG